MKLPRIRIFSCYLKLLSVFLLPTSSQEKPGMILLELVEKMEGSSANDVQEKSKIRSIMWEEYKLYVSSLPKQKFSRAQIDKKKILQMVADGRLSAACASLLSDALADPSEENLAKLKEKHPSQNLIVDIPLPSDCEQITVPPDLVLKKLRSFNKGSAAGPTGIRASHILNAIQVNNQTSVLDTLTSFVNFFSKR